MHWIILWPLWPLWVVYKRAIDLATFGENYTFSNGKISYQAWPWWKSFQWKEVQRLNRDYEEMRNKVFKK